MSERQSQTDDTAHEIVLSGTIDDQVSLTLSLSGVPHSIAATALEAARATIKNARVPATDEMPTGANGIIGTSESMLALVNRLDRVAKTTATVLITGENGTGKELIARAIHARSPRAKERFVAVNCGAFNDNLLESELFGHKRGAFTGAAADKPGLIESADRGTFFMDEVGEMSPALQVKLLRVLQEGAFLPVGGVETKRVDVRVLAATNRDLQAMVRAGTFREDLYYRLHVVALTVPPLRERRGDIEILARAFLAALCSRSGREKIFSEEAMRALCSHAWPGNVRELQNEVERAFVLAGDQPVITRDMLSRACNEASQKQNSAGLRTASSSSSEDEDMNLPRAVELLERRLIRDALERANGNRTQAADLLGISRRNLIRKVQEYGLQSVGEAR